MPKRKNSKAMEGLKPKEETKDDSLLSKISGDFLECTICLEPFKDPKVLPCLHTFCEDCLKKFVAQDKVKNKFLCPTCRTETVLPKGGVASFKNNFFVQSLSYTVQAHKSLVSKDDAKVQCDNCEEEVASHGCVACEEFLCDDCACAHHRAKRTRSHEVIGAVDLKEQLITKTGWLKSKSLPICPKHQDEKMKFYCETCKHPICRDCWVLQHKDHNYSYLADAVGNVRTEIKDKLEAARAKMAGNRGIVSAVAKKQAELDATSKKAANDIDAAAEEEIQHFNRVVRSKQTELKEKLNSITAGRSRQLSATADSAESTLGCLSSTVDFAQKVVEHGSDFDVMSMYSDVTAQLKSLLEGSTSDLTDDISYVKFEPKTHTRKKEKGTFLGNIVDEDIQDDEMDEEEEPETEATFRFMVDKFSKLKENKLSPAVFIRNLPWKILTRAHHNSNTEPNNKSLAFYLKCDADSNSLWSCSASAELRLIPQNGVQTYTRKFEHIFYSKESSWGFPEFMPWHEVCDPQNGYIKDDKIILEAYVKADAPRGEKEVMVGNSDGEDMLEEVTEEEEELQTETTFRFTIDNFSKVTEIKFSPTVLIHNLPWRMYAKRYYIASSWRLGVFLQCDAVSESLWSCHSSAELRLISQKKGVQMFQKKFDHIFYSNERDWGYRQFMAWQEVCDPQKGYIKDDKIILEACVKADVPRGIKEIIVGNIFNEEMLEKKMEEEEELQTEATFRFTVANFSKLNESKLSPAVFIHNLPWKIKCKHDPKGQPPNNKSLGVYLQCDADSKSLWSCRASYELRLIPQKNGVQTYIRNIQHVFYSKESSWGYHKFMPWHEVCDPKKGYIKDDKIILEAYVKADAPYITA